eukprot:1517243-Pyramimonas_sp.AAC.1
MEPCGEIQINAKEREAVGEENSLVRGWARLVRIGAPRSHGLLRAPRKSRRGVGMVPLQA